MYPFVLHTVQRHMKLGEEAWEYHPIFMTVAIVYNVHIPNQAGQKLAVK